MRNYEFAILRYVHDLTAGEMVNVGIVLLDVGSRYLHVLVAQRHARLTRFFGSLDAARFLGLQRHLAANLHSLNEILAAQSDGPLPRLSDLLADALPDAESSFQPSQIGSGIADSPRFRAEELFDELVRGQGPRLTEFFESEFAPPIGPRDWDTPSYQEPVFLARRSEPQGLSVSRVQRLLRVGLAHFD